MCAGERSELSRGVDGLTKAVVPDDPEVSAKSPGVWYKSLNGVVLEFCVISNGSDREAIVREPGEYLGVQQRRREKKKVGIHKKKPQRRSNSRAQRLLYAGLRTQRARPHRYDNIILI
jgi:hypothetical protein